MNDYQHFFILSFDPSIDYTEEEAEALDDWMMEEGVWSVPWDKVEVRKKLGEGQFGLVSSATLTFMTIR